MVRKALVPLQLPADPTTALQAATKQYVDGKAGGGPPRFNYTFNDAAPAPATGEIRLIDPGGANAHGAATSVTFSNTTADGALVTTRLGLIRPGNLIYLYTVADPTRWQAFQATSSAWDNGTYSEVYVTVGDGGYDDFLAGAMSMEILPGITDEVAIGATAPGSLRDLWYDTSAPLPLGDNQRWNTSWGTVVEQIYTTGGGGVSLPLAGGDTGLTVTASVVAGRKYTVEAVAHITTLGGLTGFNSLFATITDAANTELQTFRVGTNTTSEYFAAAPRLSWNQASAGSVTFKVRIRQGTINGATGYSFNGWPGSPSFLRIVDMGPIGGSIPTVDPAPAWLPVTFVNGWTQQGSFAVCGYRRIGDIVYLRGQITKLTGTAGQSAFTLPVGYRPPAGGGLYEFVVEFYSVTSIRSVGLVSIDANGIVTPEPLGNVALNQIFFSVTP